jgi:hypothetical protein
MYLSIARDQSSLQASPTINTRSSAENLHAARCPTETKLQPQVNEVAWGYVPIYIVHHLMGFGNEMK